MDKLKLLQYESGFCQKLKFKPFPRHYFALSTNPGEQFYSFSNLAVWLLNLSGSKLDQPQEYDDPNATIATILTEAKQLGIQADFPPAKLKSGAGEHVCHLMDGLAVGALQATEFTWKRPLYQDEPSLTSEVIQEEVSEVNLTQIEDQMEDAEVDSEDEAPVFLDLSGFKSSKDAEGDIAVGLDSALEATVDTQEWRLEVERVLPSLKIHVRQDNRDWRGHYEQMHVHSDGITAALSETKGYLDKLHQEITKTLEKIGSREKYINNQLEHHIQEFRKCQDELAEVKEKYSHGSGGVTTLARELAQVSEELETVKAEMDQRGTSMTDAAPLVKIKQSLTKLKAESTQMEIRLGVVEHTLLEANLKSKSAIKQQMNKTADSIL